MYFSCWFVLGPDSFRLRGVGAVYFCAVAVFVLSVSVCLRKKVFVHKLNINCWYVFSCLVLCLTLVRCALLVWYVRFYIALPLFLELLVVSRLFLFVCGRRVPRRL